MSTVLTIQNLIDNRLAPLLGSRQKIEAWDHKARYTSSTALRFPYLGWLTSPAPMFYVNGVITTMDTYDVDLGTASLSTLTGNSEVTACYTFKYFTDTDLSNFYKLALSKLNNTPPVSYFTLDDSVQVTSANYPVDMEHFLTMYSYKLCLQTILADLMVWRSRLIWTDPVTVAGIIQGVLSSLDMELTALLSGLKGRRFVTPHSVSAGRFSTPATVSDNTWMQYTVIRS